MKNGQKIANAIFPKNSFQEITPLILNIIDDIKKNIIKPRYIGMSNLATIKYISSSPKQIYQRAIMKDIGLKVKNRRRCTNYGVNMGIPVVSIGDLCTGHGCFPPRENITGEPTVLINGKPAHRVGDLWNLHNCGPAVHAGVQVSGSQTVFQGGRPLCRIGDLVDCGSVMAMGSPNVLQG